MRQARHTAITLAGLLTLALVVNCSGPGSSGGDSVLTSPIVVGTVNDAPGFDTGTINQSGFDIDVMKNIGAAQNAKTVSTIIDYASRESGLLDGSLKLVIATYSITPERNQKGIDFAGPYMVSPQALLVRADDKRFTHKAALKDKSVCTVEGSTGSRTKIPGANMATQVQTTQDCLNLLDRSDTDAVFSDALILYGYVNSNPTKYQVVLPGVFGELQYTGIGILGGHHADCAKLDELVSAFLDNQWAQDFKNNFPVAAQKYSGADTSTGDYQSIFKPTAQDMQRLSCKL
ncbi:transporter substrate-binding domain-containing protein [Streptomyces sp. RKAG337]|uniref:transporter substrate-binding domain-containing protein n=1 Tax=Streptomyces sp. RKAG337 TaxID=2893404 RepID=UPI0035A9390D